MNAEFFPRMSEDEYNRMPALRASWVKTLCTQTPAHLLHKIGADDDDTDALRIGRALHCRVLRPEDFGAEFLVSPKFDLRTKEGKAESAAFAAGAGTRTVLNADEMRKVNAMAVSVAAHESAAMLLSTCTERETVWTATIEGVPCKIRPDGLAVSSGTNAGLLVDLKTTLSAAPRAFARTCVEYGYWLQIAFYRAVLREHGVDISNAVLVAIEKGAPNIVACYELSAPDLDAAEDRVRAGIRLYNQCMRTQNWSGYSERVEMLAMPAWAGGIEQ
jgi:exodeoxyribonuclease VIII